MESYLLTSSVSLIVLYLFYQWMLRHEFNYQLNRILGFLCLFFSTTLLWIPVEGLVKAPEQTAELNMVLVQGYELFLYNYPAVLSSNAMSIYMLSYLLGVGFFSVRALIGIGTLLRFYITSLKTRQWGFNVVHIEREMSPFTFFSILFIGKNRLNKEEMNALIIHEQFHRDQLHSVDTLLLEILTIVFWFNPVVWLYRRDIKAQHEYLADEEVLKKGFDLSDYQHLLFQSRTGVSIPLASYLSKKTSLKKRLEMMMKQKKESGRSYLRAIVFIPMMGVLLACNSFFGISKSTNDVEGFESQQKGEKILADVLRSTGYLLEENSGIAIESNGKSIKNNPLFAVFDKDNKRILSFSLLEKLDWGTVQDVYVVKGEVALKDFGEAGKNGVVVIRLKD